MLEPRKRIPLHDHVDRNSGGPIASSTVVDAIGGVGSGGSGSGGGGGGVTIPGNYELNNEGGQDVIKAHGNLGATATFDPTDGNVHTGTLTANCTFTINAPAGSGAATLEFWLTQDGTGGRTITWPGSVIWDGGTPSPSTGAGVTVRYVLQSVDGGTNWIGDLIAGAAGASELNIEGGQSVIKAHGSMGSTETFDPVDGNVHTGTLNANCTFTLTSPTGSGACLLELRLLQDGTGGWAITWPGSVSWANGVTPTPVTTASTTTTYILETLDGGTTWLGNSVGTIAFATPALTYGSPAAGSAATTIRSDAVITPPTEAQVTFTNITTNNVSTSKHGYAPILPNDATKFLDGTGAYSTPAGASSSGGHIHVAEETHLSDGSTVTWTLDYYYEPGSVIAWNITTIARLLVTEVLPDKATVSAAGTMGDKIVFDYAATLA